MSQNMRSLLDDTTKLRTLHAGGPGSGRHPEGGDSRLKGNLGKKHFDAMERLAQWHEKQGGGLAKGDARDVRKFSGLVQQGKFKEADKHLGNMDTDPRERLYTFNRVGPAVSRAWQKSDPAGYAKHSDSLNRSQWKVN